jgi:hypothetical protein
MSPHLFPAYARYRNERDNPKPLVAVAGVIVAAIVIIIVLAIIVMVASGAHSLRSPHAVRPFLLELSTTIGHPNALDGVAAGKIQYRVTDQAGMEWLMFAGLEGILRGTATPVRHDAVAAIVCGAGAGVPRGWFTGHRHR